MTRLISTAKQYIKDLLARYPEYRGRVPVPVDLIAEHEFELDLKRGLYNQGGVEYRVGVRDYRPTLQMDWSRTMLNPRWSRYVMAQALGYKEACGDLLPARRFTSLEEWKECYYRQHSHHCSEMAVLSKVFARHLLVPTKDLLAFYEVCWERLGGAPSLAQMKKALAKVFQVAPAVVLRRLDDEDLILG